MIRVNLDRLLLERRVSLTELARRVGLSVPNLSLLKTGKVKEVRLALLDALCRELGCGPGDLLSYEGEFAPRAGAAGPDRLDAPLRAARPGPGGAPPAPHAHVSPSRPPPANLGIDFID